MCSWWVNTWGVPSFIRKGPFCFRISWNKKLLSPSDGKRCSLSAWMVEGAPPMNKRITPGFSGREEELESDPYVGRPTREDENGSRRIEISRSRRIRCLCSRPFRSRSCSWSRCRSEGRRSGSRMAYLVRPDLAY